MSVDHLCSLDPVFAECVRIGGPDLRDFTRPAGFPGLVRIVMEQQLSTRVAEALWAKLLGILDPVTPDGLLALPDDTLRACGFSRQKIGYVRGMAEAVAAGRFDVEAVHALPDEEAIAALCRLKGIGRWTAEIYLMTALGRPDLWPVDDLAIKLGLQRLKGWTEVPTRARLVEAGEAWRPHRSLAARLIWHHYVALQDAARKAPRRLSQPPSRV